ncbi:STAS domain-containing protein [Spirillospora sp. NPDC047279]|uniref:STAS domain-containing protein n=1 Tax=Spirillospora sp. NPDC047279 TaxID=3155478 RepID=UPI0033D1A304
MTDDRKPGRTATGRRGLRLRCRDTALEGVMPSTGDDGHGHEGYGYEGYCYEGYDEDEALPGLRVAVVRAQGPLAVVAVDGEIDLNTADTLRTVLRELDDAGHHDLVVDFTGVRFCDATGLGALVAANNRAIEHGGAVRLAGLRPAQRRLLHVTGLHRVFTPYTNVADAVTQVRSSATKALP